MLRYVALAGLAFIGCAPPSFPPESSEPPSGAAAQNRGESPLVEGAAVVEGDMVFERDTLQTIAGGGEYPVKKWPNATIPYVFDPDFKQVDRVKAAMDKWSQKTGVRFVPRTSETDYVRIYFGTGGCWSHVGMVGGKQNLSLDPNCYRDAPEHELGHLLGLNHEQTRFDRDDYIDVKLENSTEDCKVWFAKSTFRSSGTYDVHSVMHYKSFFCSKDPKNEQMRTMTLKDGSLIPEDNEISEKDAAGIREYYSSELVASSKEAVSVSLEWQIASNTATYSVDVQTSDGKWVAPCIGAAVLGRSLRATFGGSCPSAPGATVGDPIAFRLCSAEANDWAHARCATTPYAKGQTRLLLGADPD